MECNRILENILHSKNILSQAKHMFSGNHFEAVILPPILNNHSLVIIDDRYNYLSRNIPRWLYNPPSLVGVLLRGNNFHTCYVVLRKT